MIGVQCVMMGAILFPPIYWQTACLLQRSGALTGKSANYNKIAKAVAELRKSSVNVSPLNINSSQKLFSLDAKTNTIYFGFLGTKGIKDKVLQEILDKRPFSSFEDFLDRANSDITSTVALIKAGAFDEFLSREEAIDILAMRKADIKTQLNGRNLLMLHRKNYWPEELEYERYVFRIDRYLKEYSKIHKDEYPEDISYSDYYLVDEAMSEKIAECANLEVQDYISKITWSSIINAYMVPVKQYLIDNQEEMLALVNSDAIAEWKEKYFSGERSMNEIETMGVCFGDHPYESIKNLVDFNTLSQEPQIAYTFRTPQGRRVPMYELTMIAGICIAKDKLHSTITILTPTGPVDVKFRKQQFASYDAQISRVVDGHKKIIERSWFNRGVGLIIHGMRQDDLFLAKTYKNSPMRHTCYKILGIKEGHKFEVQQERKKGKSENEDD